MPINIHGKQYVLVNERLEAFNEKYKNGAIQTELSYEGDLVRCKATVTPDATVPVRAFTGHAEELRGSTQINRTSAVENCETSAVGRALAMLGIGIIESVASADEVVRALQKEGMVTSNSVPDDVDPFEEVPAQSVKKICPKCGKEHQGKYPKCLACWKVDNAKK